MTHIEELKENVRRLKATIRQPHHAEGYRTNCQQALESYEKRLAELQRELQPRHYAFVGHWDGEDERIIVVPEPCSKGDALGFWFKTMDQDGQHDLDDLYLTATLVSDSPINVL